MIIFPTDLFKLEELFTGEGRPPPPGLALTAGLQQTPTAALDVQPGEVLLLLVTADTVTVLGDL